MTKTLPVNNSKFELKPSSENETWYVCQYCSKEFTAKRKDVKWCSSICGNRRRNRTYYNKSSEKTRARFKQARITHRESFMLSRCKYRAKQQNIPFNITKEDIAIPATCPVLGIEIRQLSIEDAPQKGYHPNAASLDRIIPELGYVKGNVRVISARANLLKNDATISELELVLKDLKRIHER
jgi:hypothetical protein